MLIIAIDTKILLEDLIRAFRLAICLRVKRCGETAVNSKKFGKGFPEVRGEDGTTVRNKGFREAVEPDDVIQEHSSEGRSISKFGTRNKVNHFCKAVDKNEDSVKAMGVWEINDKIDRKRFPWARRDWESSEFAMRKVAGWLAAETEIAC